MADYSRPIKNTAYQVSISLYSFGTPGQVQRNPTIAAGDFKLNGDQSTGAPGNLATTPVLLNSASAEVKISLANTEMNYDVVYIEWRDQTSPPEWADGSLTIFPAAS